MTGKKPNAEKEKIKAKPSTTTTEKAVKTTEKEQEKEKENEKESSSSTVGSEKEKGSLISQNSSIHRKNVIQTASFPLFFFCENAMFHNLHLHLELPHHSCLVHSW